MALGFLLIEIKELLGRYIDGQNVTFVSVLWDYITSDWNIIDLFNIAILVVSFKCSFIVFVTIAGQRHQ